MFLFLVGRLPYFCHKSEGRMHPGFQSVSRRPYIVEKSFFSYHLSFNQNFSPVSFLATGIN